MSAAAPISVVVTTFEEEANIEACLLSVAGWVEQIVIVDSGSTDRTLDICRRFTDDIVMHAYRDHASQWAWALREAPVRCEWVLALDADHVVTAELREGITEAVSGPSPADGYYVRHEQYFLGRRVRGLKSRWLRLVRRSRVRVDESELVDVRFIVDGRTGSLRGALVEENRKDESIDVFVDKHQRFATRMAAEEVLRRSGRLHRTVTPRLTGGGSEQRMLWLKERWYHLPLYVRPFLYFAYRYVLRGGFLDGRSGLVFATFQAFWFRMLVDVKIAELEAQLARGELTLEAVGHGFRPATEN